MKNDGKQYNRDLEGVRQISWDLVIAIKDGKIDERKASLMTKGIENIVKAHVAEIAMEKVKLEALGRKGKILQIGTGTGEAVPDAEGEEGEREAEEGSSGGDVQRQDDEGGA